MLQQVNSFLDRVLAGVKVGSLWFARAGGVMILLTVGLVLLYMNAGQVTEAVPALSDFVANYVTVVDKARIWLDQNLSGFIPN